MERRSRKRPRYYCPDLKDDVVGELIDRCDVITSASMAGLFKTILDSTNNIITRNPRVQERFDLPYLLCYDPADWRGDEGSLTLCKLMPLNNDTCDVKMPSFEGKAWAGANGDWVVYIGSNCEWELVNVYTRQRIPLPKISWCPEVEHTDDLRTFKYDHGGCRLRKIGHDDESFSTISERKCRTGRLFVYRGKLATVHRLFAFPSRFGTAVACSSSLLHLPSPFLLPLFDRLLHGGNRPETTPLFLP